jgi:3-oxoacyl-[acyl-carrier-protein] synthase II
VLLLEELDRAVARGARIYAEVLGYGTSNDAHHMAQPDPESVGVAEMMRSALARSGVEAGQVGYINAHGTSTPQGDKLETVAIKRCFGEHARSLAVSSTKSMTGHLLGAAGGIEAVFTVLAMRDQIAPPTANLVNVDPQCDLDFVPLTARKMKIAGALSNSFGFGGTNATLAFRALP